MAGKCLSGCVCIVTGATRGIGKGIALQLSQAGAVVYITGRTLEAGENSLGGSLTETAEQIELQGGQCIPIQCDHSKDEDVTSLFDRVKREQDGRLDILVNNVYSAVAYVIEHIGIPFWELSLESWDNCNSVGLRNHYLCSVLAARLMVPRKYGLIVNISSSGGLRYLFSVAYGVGKAAVDRMAGDCARELRQDNVACVSLWPGAIDTEVISSFLDKMPSTPKDMFLRYGETAAFSGLCIARLFTGAVPINMRRPKHMLLFQGYTGLASWVPECIKVPRVLIALAAHSFNSTFY